MTLLTMIVKMSEGLGKTCAIFFLTLLFALPLGVIIALLRMNKNIIISAPIKFIVSVLRGTPLMLQLLAVTYGPYYLFDISVSRNKLIPVVIAFSINYADKDNFAEHYQRNSNPRQGYLYRLYRFLPGNVHHRQANSKFADQLHALYRGGRLLLRL